MNISLVSVIIPVYNAAQYLAGCIESIIAQTWPAIEIIIVDDGSTDGSLNIANYYRTDNIQVISQLNGGASSARNWGLHEARGEYIQFLDADDLLSPDKIELQVQALQNNPNMLAVCSTIPFYDGENHLHGNISTYDDAFLVNSDPLHFLINLWGGYKENGSMVQPNAWLCPRHVLEKAGPWNEELTVDDDGEYFTRVLLNSDGIIKTDGKNFYRKHVRSNINLSSLKDQKSILSQVKSLQLRYMHLSCFDQSSNLKTAYARSLSEIKFKLYPNGGDITSLIDKEIAALNINFKFQPIFGTKAGTLTARLFGWKIARLLQLLIR